MSPDSFNAYIGTGTGVKQLAFANGVTSATFSTATPAGNSRTVDAEPVLNFAGSAAITPAGTSIAGVRGNITIANGTTVTQGYMYGVQGKLTLKGTINVTLGEASAGLVGQLDMSAATAITSVGDSLSMCWLDAGSASAVALTLVSALTITNSIAGKPLKAIINVPLADAQFFLVSQDSADSPWSADPAASGKTFQNKGLKVSCNGSTYWIPLYA